MSTTAAGDVSGYWNTKTFVVITGASRGIGKAAAEEMAPLLGTNSLILLVSRDEPKLISVKEAIMERCSSSKLNIKTAVVDLSTSSQATLESMLVNTLSGCDVQSFNRAVCIHNAGSLGDASVKCVDLTETNECTDYFHLNVVSVMLLNGLFLRYLANCQQRTVVNISSLCAIEPFTSLSLYCTGKAARDMFFKVLQRVESK